MTIVCGTDFSERAKEAADVAAALAKRTEDKLLLVHVIDEVGAELTLGGGEDKYYEPRRQALNAEAERLRATGAEVETLVHAGFPDTVLSDLAAESAARVLVVGATGRRAPERWLVGSVAERVAQEARRPVLVVRAPAPLLAWLEGTHPLTAVVGADLSTSSRGALAWLPELRALGATNLHVVHSLFSPLPSSVRGFDAAVSPGGIHPEVERKVRRQLERALPRIGGEGTFEISVYAGADRPDLMLAGTATSDEAGLIVVGAHQRSGFARLWHESISRQVLRVVGMNVAVIPPPDHMVTALPIPSIRKVLVATDLSVSSRRAVPYACSLLPNGGKVVLAHVMRTPPAYAPDAPRPNPERARAELGFLVPPEAAGRGIDFELELVEATHVAETICELASRHEVDVVCLGTHGHSRLASAFLGSVSQQVVGHAHMPVLLVTPDG